MSTTTRPPSDIETIETEALDRMEDAGPVEAALDEAAAGEEVVPPREGPDLRVAFAIVFPVIAAAVMVGGVFTGAGARVYAAIGGVLGIAVALVALRSRRALTTNAVMLLGLFVVGLVTVAPSGLGEIGSLRSHVANAVTQGDVLRPPVPLTPGWQAIVGWLLGLVGFLVAWVALEFKRPALALLLPIPVAAIAGISVPPSRQVASGITALVLFVLGLGLLSSAQSFGEGDVRPPLAYEIRRGLRSLPLVAVVTGLLVLASQLNILFPATTIDPAKTPQRPKTVPLSEVEDRVLFSVQSEISGPWRIGSLDVYDGKDWRLPPFSASKLKTVPRDGVVDRELTARLEATFTINGLNGAVLPGLSNITGIVAEGPQLAYDSRSGNLRVAQGQVRSGLSYRVAAAGLPQIEDLQADTEPIPASVRDFVEMPNADPPPAVQTLIDQAPKTSKWDTFDFLRNKVLDTVTATGSGVPVSIPPSRIQEMLAGEQEGTPFEIVAAQAMLARWVGIPSRIGYGFDGGDILGDNEYQVRPRNGATFVEVYFPGYKWLPVVGTPRKAKPTVGSDPGQQRVDSNILPSDDVAVQLFIPSYVDPPSVFGQRLLRTILIALPIVAVALLVYLLYPAMRKSRLRSRRRAAANSMGARERIAVAYSEWRDAAADFGFAHSTDTPLMYLDRFAADDEHTELAWLTTRALWGDLKDDLTAEHAVAAEELSRALRRRLANAQPATMRAVAFVSRLSLRHPFAPDLDQALNDAYDNEQAREVRDAAVVPA